MNFIILLLYFITILLIMTSYGFFTNKIILNSHINKISIGESGLLSISILLLISLLIHFLIPINSIVISIIISVGLILFLFFIKEIIYVLKKTPYYYLIGLFLIFVPFIIIFNFHDDYNYYHLPYLNYLQSNKIIFGLANINTPLAYPQNSWLNFVSLFRIPNVGESALHIANAAIFFFFILYNVEKYFESSNKVTKLYSLIFIILSFSLFSRLRDFGSEIIPQLIILTVSNLTLHFFLSKPENKSEIVFKILIFSAVAIILRVSSFIVLPFIITIIVFEIKNIFYYLKNFKLIFFITILILLFLSKNIINSGCLIYPIDKLCIDQTELQWSIGKEIPKINKNLLLAYSHGWMIYAKEKIKTNEKFIFNPSTNILTHKEYIDLGIKNWIKYWLKDYDFIRFLNILYICAFITFCFVVFNRKLFSFNNFNEENKNILKLSCLFFIPVALWFFLSTPALRYGGYSAVIPLFTILAIFFINVFLSQNYKIKFPIIFLVFLSTFYFTSKNITRINNDLLKNNSLKLSDPWPKHTELKEDIDYTVNIINNTELALRLPSKKLFIGNLSMKNNYQLHCGNIKKLCMPEKKINCIEKIEEKKGYKFVTNNLNKCLEILNYNAHY